MVVVDGGTSHIQRDGGGRLVRRWNDGSMGRRDDGDVQAWRRSEGRRGSMVVVNGIWLEIRRLSDEGYALAQNQGMGRENLLLQLLF